MFKAAINGQLCLSRLNCKDCFKGCPKRAIFKLDLDDNAIVERALCNGCGDCLSSCPVKAIKLEEI